MDRDDQAAHEHGDPAHPHQRSFDSQEMAHAIERDGDELLDLVTEAAAELADVCVDGGASIGRILDLGCGPGVGTCCLAERFTAAKVVGVDSSPAMLERATARALRLGLVARVTFRRIDLATELDALESAEIVWASMALHHLSDEAAVFARLRVLLGADGLFAIIDKTPDAAVYGPLLAGIGYDLVIDRPLSASRQLLVARPNFG